MVALREATTARGFKTVDGVHMGPCELHRRHAHTIGPNGALYACPGFAGEADQAVGDRAAQDAADQRRPQWQIGGVAGAAGDLVDAVDQRRAHADAGSLVGPSSGADVGRSPVSHPLAPAAARTDSTIFT